MSWGWLKYESCCARANRAGRTGIAGDPRLRHQRLQDQGRLTLTRLVTTLTTAIRSAYDQLANHIGQPAGLRQIVDSANDLFARRGLENFAEGVLTLNFGTDWLATGGLIAAKGRNPPGMAPEMLEEPVIVSAAGRFRGWMNHPLHEIGDSQIAQALRSCLERRISWRLRVIPRYFSRPVRSGRSRSI